jgi:plastocyanin
MVLSVALVALMSALAGGCGNGSDGGGAAAPGEGGEERTVLVDYRHDEFASAFLRYYPSKVQVRPGDAVRFKQAWTGEPHSVTMGKVVDSMFEVGERFEKYDSEEEALAGGETPESIASFLSAAAPVPGMTAYSGFDIYQPGAQPCYVGAVEDVPKWSDPDTEQVDPAAVCPEGGKVQPAFTGRQGLYNSGFIAPTGTSANTFVVPVAEDAEPGTYRYFCNYHWTSMSGTIEVVAKDAAIPSQQAVSRQARTEIDRDAKVALSKVQEAQAKKLGAKIDDLQLPLAGRTGDDAFAVTINEFLPRKITTRVGQKVTWTFDGITHTVSFNVPKYFPIFTVEKDGKVVRDPQSFEPVAWDVPPAPHQGDDGADEPEPRHVDVGSWDGKGGFHSSGAFDPGETFAVTFTKPGSYPFACVLHPQMVGTLEVR